MIFWSFSINWPSVRIDTLTLDHTNELPNPTSYYYRFHQKCFRRLWAVDIDKVAKNNNKTRPWKRLEIQPICPISDYVYNNNAKKNIVWTFLICHNCFISWVWHLKRKFVSVLSKVVGGFFHKGGDDLWLNFELTFVVMKNVHRNLLKIQSAEIHNNIVKRILPSRFITFATYIHTP